MELSCLFKSVSAGAWILLPPFGRSDCVFSSPEKPCITGGFFFFLFRPHLSDSSLDQDFPLTAMFFVTFFFTPFDRLRQGGAAKQQAPGV